MTDTIIINVKGVKKSSWNLATQAASLRKEPYGPYLSEALDLRLRFDAGEVKAPGEDGNTQANPPLTEDQRTARIAALAALAQGIAAVKQHTGRATGVGLLSTEVRSLLPVKPQIIRGKETGGLGQSSRIIQDALLPDSANREQDEGLAIVAGEERVAMTA